MHPDGGFLSFQQVRPGAFTFQLDAYLRSSDGKRLHRRFATRARQSDETDIVSHETDSVHVYVSSPLKTLSCDSLVIAGEYHAPTGDLALSEGDVLPVMFHGTPGCMAWFAIPGVVDSVPMSEAPSDSTADAVSSVFAHDHASDSVSIRGIYSGYYEVPATVKAESVRVQYFLTAPPPVDYIRSLLWKRPVAGKPGATAVIVPKTSLRVQRESSYTLTLNSSSYPVTVRFTDSVQIVRYAPQKGYLSIFQPRGVEALAVGAEGDWFKIQLSTTQVGWVGKSSVVALPRGILPPKSYPSLLRVTGAKDRVTVTCPLSGRHPFRVIEEDSRTLRVQLFGVTGNTDWIRYDSRDSLVQLITWSQPEEGVYEISVHLTGDIWGYDTYYDGTVFCLQLNKPPTNVHRLAGKTIVLDPGHSQDPGAIGPTGYTEAEANLAIALSLRKELEKRGARVVMTRDDDRHVPLYDRPVIAKQHDADLFVSLHNNALPDGVNPFVNNGTSAYYYHPHSVELARRIHTEMLKATRLPDHGLYHGNLAVARPTQYPAVLVECAFMMIPEQEAMLKTDAFRRKVAVAIRRGIESLLKGYADAR